MRKIIILTSILFVAVIAAAVLYFKSLHDNSRSQNRTIMHIPADAAFLVSFQNDQSFYNIFDDFEIFEAVIGKEAQHELTFLHKQVLKPSDLAQLIAKQTLYFSFHPTKERIGYLITIPFRVKVNEEEAYAKLNTAIRNIGQAKPDSIAENLYQVTLDELKRPFFIAFRSGTALLSFDKNLIEKALDDKEPHLSSNFIQELNENSHKNNNAIFNLHLNHDQLFKLVTDLTRVKPGNNLQLLEGLKGMSSLNMNFKSDALMFNGQSTVDANNQSYLALYTHQKASDEQLKEILTANTAAYAAFTFSDYPSFHNQLTQLLDKRKQLNRINDQLNLIKSSKKVDINEELLSAWDNEFASVELNTRENIGIVKLKDSSDFVKMIEKISSPAAENMRRFDNSNLLYYSFGDPMLPFQRPYFTIINNYMVCANTISTLQQYRKQYEEQRLLVNTLPYLAFNKLRSDKSNISFFINNENAARNLRRTLQVPFEKAYSDTSAFDYKNFYAFSYQLSGYNGNFYSNFIAKYSLPSTDANEPVWEFGLNQEINYPPQVFAYNDSANFIITQDQSNVLYALSSDGKELWRTSLSGEILGSIQQLPDRSIIFNTANRLYRFNTNGNSSPGFPVAIPHEASNGLTIFNPQQSDFKVFIPGYQRIFAYDENGKALSEWENKTVQGNIVHNLKTALLNDHNYIIALTDIGNIYYFNHNSSLIDVTESKNKFKNTFSIEITPGTPEESRIITTDTSGMLLSFYFDKNLTRTNLGRWSENHHFETANLLGDSIPELIFIDKKQLHVYNSKDSTLHYDHTFDTEINTKLLYFPTTNNRKTLGISSMAKLLYVFDEDGSIIKSFPVEGLPDFYYGKLKNDGHRYVLLSKGDKKLAAYVID
ncbi:hypothetical protein H8S90_01650 [Olivibacter sp. SDN3]|uniref:hypothetical protein n=1 Tax=Olivibacter sp. SDN3 TaxID=2764720 RepID=UPI0016519690|nr:hypothetical protein [Olivibacter sp. SDN3]QNL50358.1 hypothetical protein H8S90_01650 [Olivibacter sp. SDN3]